MSMPARRISAALPSATRAAARPCRYALAGDRVETRSASASVEPALAAPRDDRGRQRMFARALERWPRAAAVRPRRGRRRRTTGTTLRLAFGQRAGLVDDQRIDLLERSSASAFLMSTPARRALPTPTMIDIGVARPSAHGHAMISTATAAISA